MIRSSRKPTQTQLAALISLTLTVCGTQSAHAAPGANAPALGEVVVSASRGEQYTDDLPLSMDVVNTSELEESQVGDIRDIAKVLPNVAVKRAPARFGVTGRGNAVGADANAGFTIRGQGGNRVVMLVDGVRLPRSYVNGSNAFGRDSVSVGLLKRVEIIHGPSSVLYGSDGLAGLVNFITLEPADYLISRDGVAKSLGAKAWLSYSGDDEGITAGATLAARANDSLDWSLSGTTTRASGMSNMGSNDAANLDRTTPNPQTSTANSLLGKLVFRPTATQSHVVTLEHVQKDTDIDLLSSRVKLPVAIALNYASLNATQKTAAPTAAVVSETSEKQMTRTRITWDTSIRLDSGLADGLKTVLSWQDSHAQDDGQTLLKTAWPNDGARVRKTSYQERSWQASVQAEKTLKLSSQWSHKLSYGLDYASTDIASFADGSDPAPLPVFSPRKYFPDTRDTSQAIFVQSELISDQWSITPGVRFDRFVLDVLSQSGYYPGIAKEPAKSLSGSAVSPKLGVLYRVAPQWSVYGNYASGFRAPEGQQVNSALDVSTARLLPNPDLKPENSRNVELGLRARHDRLSLDIAAFSSAYNNLIQEKKDLGTANGLAASTSNPTLFQTVNIDKATIRGFEIKGVMDWGQAAGGKWRSPFAYGQTRGTNDSTGLPLTYMDPAKLSLGLKYETSDWDLRVDIIHRQEKTTSDLDIVFIPKSTTQYQFVVPAATTLDLSGQWRVRKDLRLNFAINNLTDRKYWNWSDVQGLSANATPLVVDAYTQPGRHINLSLVADF